MSSLVVKVCEPDGIGCEGVFYKAPPSWGVALPVGKDHRIVVWGFASERDAGRAKQALEESGVDWDGGYLVAAAQWKELGGRSHFMKLACERLAW
jgi:hypothetical protein